MKKVNRETLLNKIGSLELMKEIGAISLNGEYTLTAYKMLLATMDSEPVVPDERNKTVDFDDHPLLWSFNEGWNACRATMLNRK